MEWPRQIGAMPPHPIHFLFFLIVIQARSLVDYTPQYTGTDTGENCSRYVRR
jgi:hypothetical protein